MTDRHLVFYVPTVSTISPRATLLTGPVDQTDGAVNGGGTDVHVPLRHLVTLLGDLQDLGVGFVSLGEGIDLGTPSGRLQLHVMAALAEFEQSDSGARQGRARPVKAEGRRLGRPTQTPGWDKLAGGGSVDPGCGQEAEGLAIDRAAVADSSG